ncbi:DUF4123 domain-containing protein [Acinetobacter courvalinii]|uniref:DUF4123 domain-containing protein n=1 Tax=Acinetobacter courvalinii TaxID=280147 RepID=UPI0021D13F29|nr:DUF4123 domain-containing protein [Acinetobacter courvalinii]MCU4576393.1 DUF4123 domain-containing protein [Acinetobacter courvalinii]
MDDIPKNFVTKIDAPESIIFEANYIIFDASLWSRAHSILKDLNVEHHFIGLNVFRRPELTPTLIDLNNLSNEKKEQLWNLVGKKTHTNAFSGFDQMSMFQTYLYSDKRIEEMKDFLSELMVYKRKSEKFVFRFYDPRVAIHLSQLSALLNMSIYKKLQDDIFKWVVSMNHQYFEVNKQKVEVPVINFDEIDPINSKIRSELTTDYDDLGNEISKDFNQNMNELINFIYKEQLSEKENGE